MEIEREDTAETCSSRLNENLWLAMIAVSTALAVYYYEADGWLGVSVMVFWIAVIVGIILALFHAFDPQRIQEQAAIKAEAAARKTAQDRQMICPHCQQRGTVRTEKISVKKGIDGGKATAALLTGGVTMLATGLSRKEELTKATCAQCGAVWHF